MATRLQRLQSGRKALGKLVERKAFDSYIRRGTVPEVFEALRMAASDERKFIDFCAALSTKALGDGKPTTHYTWRTTGDDRVRHAHAALAGQIFSWSLPPEGGHPGSAHNCRCWAEPYYGNPSVPDALLTLVPDRQRSTRTSDVWASIDTLSRPDGSIASSNVAMRDGTVVRSTFSGQIVSHTVRLLDAGFYRSDRLGEGRQVSVSQSGSAVAQVAWLGRTFLPSLAPPPPTSPAAPSASPLRIPGEPSFSEQLSTPFGIMVRGALALYNSMVAAPRPHGAGDADLPIFAIKVWQGVGSDGNVAVNAEALTAEQVAQTCRLMPEVQDWTDSTAAALSSMRAHSTPQQWGTAVHSAVNQHVISLKKMFPARYGSVFPEFSILPDGRNNVFGQNRTHYGAAETSRLDIFEQTDATTACIYDVKTGRRGLSISRAEDFVRRVSRLPGVNTIIVIEVGITWLPSGR